jgi:hypothetical protein
MNCSPLKNTKTDTELRFWNHTALIQLPTMKFLLSRGVRLLRKINFHNRGGVNF